MRDRKRRRKAVSPHRSWRVPGFVVGEAVSHETSGDETTTAQVRSASARREAAAAPAQPKSALERLNDRFGYLVGDVIPEPSPGAFGPAPNKPVPISYPEEMEHLNELA